MGSSSRFVKRKTSASTRAGKLPAKPTTPAYPAFECIREFGMHWRLLRIADALGVDGDNAQILEALAHLQCGVQILDGLPDTFKIGNMTGAEIARDVGGSDGFVELESLIYHRLLASLASTRATGGAK